MNDQTNDDLHVVTADVSCTNCTHRNVCSIRKGIEPMLVQQWTGDDRPIDTDELAVICDEFDPEGDATQD